MARSLVLLVLCLTPDSVAARILPVPMIAVELRPNNNKMRKWALRPAAAGHRGKTNRESYAVHINSAGVLPH